MVKTAIGSPSLCLLVVGCSQHLQLRIAIQSNPDQPVLCKIRLPDCFHAGKCSIKGKPVSEALNLTGGVHLACVFGLNEAVVHPPHWLALCCTQLIENDPITQTKWEQLAQTHTRIHTLCLSAWPAARSCLNRRELVLEKEAWANKKQPDPASL